MGRQGEFIWRYGDIDVSYTPAVDGGGTNMTPPLIDFIQHRFGAKRRFGTALEWGAGPGFIGFGLLAEGMCDFLCLADINPQAIECVNRTIKSNELQDRVRAYLSDNFDSIPKCERFDLVVGNPPSFCAGNPAHPSSSQLKGDIRGHDPDWKVHRVFYSQIAPFLNPDALVLMLEVNLYDREVLMQGSDVPIDIRPEEPHLTFTKMTHQGGLTHVEDAAFTPQGPLQQSGLNFWIQISQKSAEAVA